MVNWIGVPECDSNKALLYFVLSWVIPGIAQIIAGYSDGGHSDSVYIGVGIILTTILFPTLSFILLFVLTFLTFGVASFLFSFWPLVFALPYLWSIAWVKLKKIFFFLTIFFKGINCVVKNDGKGGPVQMQPQYVSNQPQQPQQQQQPMQQQQQPMMQQQQPMMQQQQPMMQQPIMQQQQPMMQPQQEQEQQQQQQYVDQNGQLYVLGQNGEPIYIQQ